MHTLVHALRLSVGAEVRDCDAHHPINPMQGCRAAAARLLHLPNERRVSVARCVQILWWGGGAGGAGQGQGQGQGDRPEATEAGQGRGGMPWGIDDRKPLMILISAEDSEPGQGHLTSDSCHHPLRE